LKLKRWRNAIDEIYQGILPQHPVSIGIKEANGVSRLSKSWFKRVLKARERILMQPHFQTLEAMEQYSEDTQSSILYLHLEALGISDNAADHAAGHLGKAIGLTLLLRSIPFTIEKGMVGLPSDIMSKYGISTENVLRDGPDDAFNDAVFALATRAHDQLLTARSISADVPPEAFPAMINSVLIFNFVDTLCSLS
jgi:NADH dehydrogenase [ubiquinone] 1 alpha subcomplex assembly factor 6